MSYRLSIFVFLASSVVIALCVVITLRPLVKLWFGLVDAVFAVFT